MAQLLLYLSAFFEKNYDRYIDYLLKVSKSGAWENWISFFLEGVEVTANSAIKKSQALQDLHRNYFFIGTISQIVSITRETDRLDFVYTGYHNSCRNV